MTDDTIIEVEPDSTERETTTDYAGARATYACVACGEEIAVNETPHRDGPVTITVGCSTCGEVRVFRWRLDPAYIAHLDDRERERA